MVVVYHAGAEADVAGAFAADADDAVLLAEAAIGRSVADGGYLSARQLSVDLRHAAD